MRALCFTANLTSSLTKPRPEKFIATNERSKKTLQMRFRNIKCWKRTAAALDTRVEVSPPKIANRCKICGEFEKKCKICDQCDESGEKNTFKRCIFFTAYALKENFSPLPAECVENNFSALLAECGEEKFSPLPTECGEKKNFSPQKLQILQIFTANFKAYLKFTRNFNEVSGAVQ